MFFPSAQKESLYDFRKQPNLSNHRFNPFVLSPFRALISSCFTDLFFNNTVTLLARHRRRTSFE